MQKARGSHAGATWHARPRGTQGHVAEPRGPAQRAYVVRFIYIIYFYYIYR